MTITIRLQTDNAAFQDQDGDPRYEVARIVRQIASWFVDDGLYLDGADTYPPLRDSNGNTVGSVTVTGRPKPTPIAR